MAKEVRRVGGKHSLDFPLNEPEELILILSFCRSAQMDLLPCASFFFGLSARLCELIVFDFPV